MDRTVSTVAANRSATANIADVQSSADSRRIAIDKVGIKNIRHPVRIKDRSGQEQHTVATFNMYVYLPHNFKGTHMSRFVAILNGHEHEIGVGTFKEMLKEMAERLESEAGHIEMRFPVLHQQAGAGHRRRQPARLRRDADRRDPRRQAAHVHQGGGAGHQPLPLLEGDLGLRRAQSALPRHRRGRTRGFLWIEELIEMVEAEASCELYGLLKRPDEKYVTERAYDNPKFVEDTVRDVARRLNDDERISAYVVEAENFESIHNHSAYALIECDKERL
jgi:GTP cyclohydrolase I